MKTSEAVTRLDQALSALGTPERAAAEKAYLHSDLRFYGATVWQIRAAVKEVLGEWPDLGHDEVLALAEELWAVRVHELRMSAVVVLGTKTALLAPADLGFLERLIRESGTWAYVDALAGDTAGTLVLRDPVGTRPALDRWATDPDFWVRRSALLALLLSVRSGDAGAFDHFTAYADGMLEEKEFFIRKAIGWVLRESTKRAPEPVVAWLAPRTHRASRVTMREAVKYVEAVDRDRLMLAYREKRPAVEVAR